MQIIVEYSEFLKMEQKIKVLEKALEDSTELCYVYMWETNQYDRHYPHAVLTSNEAVVALEEKIKGLRDRIYELGEENEKLNTEISQIKRKKIGGSWMPF